MLALLSAAALAALPQATPSGRVEVLSPVPACTQAPQTAADRDAAPRLRPLGELPPAELLRAVNRHVGDCALLEVRIGATWNIRPAGPWSAGARPAAPGRR